MEAWMWAIEEVYQDGEEVLASHPFLTWSKLYRPPYVDP